MGRDKNRLRIANLYKMIYALTYVRHQQPVNARLLHNNFQMLNYKQWKHKLFEGGDYALNKMSLQHKITTFYELMGLPLDIFITLAEDDYGYEGTTNEFIVKWVHPLFLKSHAEASNEENPN